MIEFRKFLHTSVVAVLLLCGVNILSAQNLSKVLEYAPNKGDFIVQIESIGEDLIVLSGNYGCVEDLLLSTCAFLSRITKEGEIIWQTTFEPDYPDDYAFIGSNKNFEVIGDQLLVYLPQFALNNSDFSGILYYQLDFSGDIIESGVLEIEPEQPNVFDIEKLETSHLVVIRTSGYTCEIVEFDSNSKVINQFQFDSPDYIFDANIISIADTVYLAVSVDKSFGFRELQVHKYTADFDLIDSYQGNLVNEINAFVFIENIKEKLYVSWTHVNESSSWDTVDNNAAIIILDLQLNLLNEKKFNNSFTYNIHSLRVFEEQLYVAGFSDFYIRHGNYDQASWEAWISVIDAEDNIVMDKHILDERYLRGGFLLDSYMSEEGITLVGVIDTVNSSGVPYFNDPDSWFLTLTSDGCWNDNCDDFIIIKSDTSSITQLVENNYEIKLYPNPTSNYITFSSTIVDHFKVEIFDISGKIVLSFDHEIDEYHNHNLPQGMYFVRCLTESEGLIYQQKMVVSGSR